MKPDKQTPNRISHIISGTGGNPSALSTAILKWQYGLIRVQAGLVYCRIWYHKKVLNMGVSITVYLVMGYHGVPWVHSSV